MLLYRNVGPDIVLLGSVLSLSTVQKITDFSRVRNNATVYWVHSTRRPRKIRNERRFILDVAAARRRRMGGTIVL
jgi:hypothetical protein